MEKEKQGSGAPSPLEPLKNELRKKAQSQAQQLLSEGQEQAEQIISQARKQAQKEAEEALQQAQALASEEGLKVSSARLRAGRILAQAREAAISRALSHMSGELAPKRGTDKAYAKLFEKLARNALRQIEGGVIRCRKQDIPMARKLGNVGEPISCIGGLVVESRDGLIKLDATFEGLMEEHREELKKKAFELLYGK